MLWTSLLLLIVAITLISVQSKSITSKLASQEDPLDYIHKLKTGKVIIDTDIGSDDAVAILNALQYIKQGETAVEIIGFTCVHGNTKLENVKHNILKTLKVANRLEIPVYSGVDRSILTTPKSDNYFGEDGLGDFYFPNPPSIDLIQKEHAVQALIRLVREHPGEITILAIGPLTNLALAIRLDPTFRRNVKQIMIMGGSVNGYGNMPPNIEFNFYMDPEANFIVFNSTTDNDAPLIILPWDTMELEGQIEMEWRQNVLGTIDNNVVKFLNKAEQIGSMNRQVWWASDGMLVAIGLQPKLATKAEIHYVQPVVGGEFRGGLIVDRSNVNGLNKNTIIITGIDKELFKQFLLYNLSYS